jgi:2-desacetyl-2-hydroxyethyl bacteriochlorophyllide A dehydrogenase
MKSQQIVFPEKGRCLVEEVDYADQPTGANVLIRNRRSLVSAGTELSFYSGTNRCIEVPEMKWAKYPFRPGYAGVGEVLAVGPEVRDLQPGQVIFHAGKHGTVVQIDDWGWRFPLPPGMDEEAALFAFLAEVSMTAVRVAPPVFGQNVVVLGMGVVGILAARLYKLAGARVVAGADLSERRLELARRCGAIDLAFPVRDRPLADWTKNLGPRGAEIVVEAIGSSATIETALKSVAAAGRVVLLGSPRVKMQMDPYWDIHRRGVQVIGAHGNAVDEATRRRDRPFLIELLASGRLPVRELITHHLALADAVTAYEGLLKQPDDFVGVVLTYPPPAKPGR